MPKGKWRRTAYGSLLSPDGRWNIRPITAIMTEGGRAYWLYRDGGRFTPTGKYDDVVSFSSAAEAMNFVNRMTTRERERCGQCLHVGTNDCLELRLAYGAGEGVEECKSFLPKAGFPYGSKKRTRRIIKES